MRQNKFEEQIRTKIEGYSPQDCPDIWSNIEAALDGEKRSKRIVPLWVVGVAASLILIVTAGLLVQNFSKEDAQIAELPINNEAIRGIVDTQIRPELSTAEPTTAITMSQPQGQRFYSVAQQVAIASLVSQSFSDSPNIVVVNKEATEVQNESDSAENKAKSLQRSIVSKGTYVPTNSTNGYSNSISKAPKGEHTLMFRLSTNNSIVNISQRNDGVTSINQSSDRRMMGLMQLANADIIPKTELQHYQPVTVVLTARKRLSERFSLESGLSYSYLYSKSKTNVGVERKETQELHYVGIPVSGIVDIVKGKQWSLYAKAGGQIQMNVASRWNEKWTNQGREFANTTVKDFEDRPQFSAHLALGVGYNITKSVQLSLEPGVHYSFDNQSEVENFYKERPVSGALNVALSYLF